MVLMGTPFLTPLICLGMDIVALAMMTGQIQNVRMNKQGCHLSSTLLYKYRKVYLIQTGSILYNIRLLYFLLVSILH